MGITRRHIAVHNTQYNMYTDKINPDHPEGRLLILPTGFQLKAPSLPISAIPLHEKAPTLFKHLDDSHFEVESKARMRRAYEAICKSKAERNISRYNKLLKDMPEERKFLSWWLLYDWYDMLPDGRRINANAAYYSLSPYYRSLIDRCMEAGLQAHVRELTVSVEASMTAPFLLHLQKNNVSRMGNLKEQMVRDFTRSGRCAPMALYRMSLFLRRYAVKEHDTEVLSVLHFFPKEKLVRRIYEAFTHQDREKLEAFILSEECTLSKRDRAIIALMLYTGMRGCDVRDLKLKNIDWAKGTIKFRQGKTLGDVILPLRPVVGNLIYEYVTTERPSCGDEYCFISNARHSGKYSRPNISDVTNHAYDLCGIRQNGVRKGPHLLRHSMADEMVNEGSDVTMVTKTLGHLSPNTSLGYMSSNIEQLRACALSIEPYPVTHKLYCHE